MSIFPEFRTACVSLLVALAAYPAFAATAQNLAILDFKANNTSAGDAAAVSGFVRSAFVKAGAYSVVDKANMDRIMTEQAFQQTGCTDENCAVKVGKLLNVQKMVVGEYTVVGGVRFLTGSLVDVETGKIEKTGKVKGFEPGNVDEAAEKLAAELMGLPAAPSDSAAQAGAAAHSTRPEASLRAVAAGAATEAEAAKQAEQEAARKEKERIRAERAAAKALEPVDPRVARGQFGIGLNSPGVGMRLLVGSRWLVEARGQYATGGDVT